MDRAHEDRKHMKTALRLAARGRGYVSPNPMVGAVVVRRGKVVGRGWHRRFGDAHAEVNALRSKDLPVASSIASTTRSR